MGEGGGVKEGRRGESGGEERSRKFLCMIMGEGVGRIMTKAKIIFLQNDIVLKH